MSATLNSIWLGSFGCDEITSAPTTEGRHADIATRTFSRSGNGAWYLRIRDQSDAGRHRQEAQR